MIKIILLFLFSHGFKLTESSEKFNFFAGGMSRNEKSYLFITTKDEVLEVPLTNYDPVKPSFNLSVVRHPLNAYFPGLNSTKNMEHAVFIKYQGDLYIDTIEKNDWGHIRRYDCLEKRYRIGKILIMNDPGKSIIPEYFKTVLVPYSENPSKIYGFYEHSIFPELQWSMFVYLDKYGGVVAAKRAMQATRRLKRVGDSFTICETKRDEHNFNIEMIRNKANCTKHLHKTVFPEEQPWWRLFYLTMGQAFFVSNDQIFLLPQITPDSIAQNGGRLKFEGKVYKKQDFFQNSSSSDDPDELSTESHPPLDPNMTVPTNNITKHPFHSPTLIVIILIACVAISTTCIMVFAYFFKSKTKSEVKLHTSPILNDSGISDNQKGSGIGRDGIPLTNSIKVNGKRSIQMIECSKRSTHSSEVNWNKNSCFD